MTRQHCIVVVAVASMICGCSKSLYSWGTYEASVFRMYSSREVFDPADEASALHREVDRARERNQAVPPGKWAHLGYLYLLSDSREQAQACFEEELRAFPESEAFMKFLAGRVK
ncbi:MAG: DUF4810 domain-containing protein [Phycisphaerales bacterium]|nr:DUF4810 domain-containing protein [Phycisphaerales bacterium]